MGPQLLIEVLPYCTYRVEKNKKETVQRKSRIQLHVAAYLATEPILPREGTRTLTKVKAKPQL